MLRLGDDLVVRIPRREAAAHLVRHEQLVLPRIARRLPLPVPAPVRIGRPSEAYPWHWSVLPWFEGEPVVTAGLRSDEALGAALGRFLVALHEPAPDDAPPNPVRGVPVQHRAAAVAERLGSGLVADADRVQHVFMDALDAPPWSGPPLDLHGDLHPANLLHRAGRLTAVIDFGDVTAGDPATDLATAWLTLDAGPRAVLADVVRPDAATWRRARGWAVVMASAMVTTAEPGGAIHDIGVAALEQVLLPA
jgi:aminoglycoside phosphotransferase (APT) family kinase protein